MRKAQHNALIMPVFYLGPVSYFYHMLHAEKVILELHEHYVKQSYRSRCVIYGANGPLRLTIPVRHTGSRIPMKDVRICNDHPWQQLHWKSLTSAYRSSPFFEFYESYFHPFYTRPFHFLLDFNEQLIQTVLHILQIEISLYHSSSYEKKTKGKELRNCEHAYGSKQLLPRYTQVFWDRCGFLPDLSIVDLIFNTGNDALSYFDRFKLS